MRADDGTVRLTTPHTSVLHVDTTAHGKKAKKKARKGDEVVEFAVQLNKRDRKRLRKKAAQFGWTADEAAAHVLKAWADS